MDKETRERNIKAIAAYIEKYYKPEGDDESKRGGFFDAILPKKQRKYLPGARYARYEVDPTDLIWKGLEAIKNKIELTFSEKLIELIKKSGQKPSEIYNKAEISKAHFSKIRHDKFYHPTKATALAFSIALHLSIRDTEDFIGRAGYMLSMADQRDVIVRACLEKKIYNVGEVNEYLEMFGEKALTNRDCE